MADRVYCLYRVSTAKQVDHNENNEADIPVQRKACHQFADQMGWTIVRELQENGISGFKVSAKDRDQLQIIREDALKKKFDILLVFMFDRLGRKSDETPFVVEWFVQNGIHVWSAKEGEQRFDSHTDRLTNYIRFWQADGESQKTAMRTKTALGQMVQEGRFRGGVAPFGYRLEKSGVFNKRRHEVNKLVVDEDEAAVIKQMFSLVVASGFGKWRLARFLNDKGILNRGKPWHDATVGAILHNITYRGVLRSGESFSEPFEELRIIDDYTFQKALELMLERVNEKKDTRTAPLNTTGMSLLSGNVFCGHCGGRLTLTTNGKVVTLANGERKGVKRFRYVCYNKTRHMKECDGPTGYTMHLLDEQVTSVLHDVFDRMAAATDEDIISTVQDRNLLKLKAEIKRVKAENTRANTEYESLKAEVIKAVQGKSKMPMDVLSELVDESRNRVLSTSTRLTELLAEQEASDARDAEMRAEIDKIRTWREIFDTSEMDVKKMIANYIIKRVNVYRDYELDIVLNMNVQQYLSGIDSITQGQPA